MTKIATSRSLSAARILPILLAFFVKMASASAVDTGALNGWKNCQPLLQTESVTEGEYFVSDAELSLLLNLENGLAVKMLKAWVEASETDLRTKFFLDVSTARISEKFLDDKGAERLTARRATHARVATDGTMLGQLLLDRVMSQRSLERLADLWKELSILLLPPGSDPSLTATSILKMARLLHLKPSERVEPAPRPVPVADSRPSEVVSTEVMKEIGYAFGPLTQNGWYRLGRLQQNFESLLGQIVSPLELEKLRPQLEKIGLKYSDATGGNRPGPAQRRVLAALRLLDSIVDPRNATENQSEAWVLRVIERYKTRVAHLTTGRVKPQTLVSTEEAVASTLPPLTEPETSSPPSMEPLPVVKTEVRLTGPVANAIVKADSELPGYKQTLKSKDFQQFMRENAHLSIVSAWGQSQREIVYSELGSRETLRVRFRAVEDNVGSPLEILVTAFSPIETADANHFYGDVARRLEIEPGKYFFPGGRVVTVGDAVTASVKISPRVYMRTRLKQRLGDDEIRRILTAIREVTPAREEGSYSALVQVGHRNFKVFLIWTQQGEMAVKEMFER